MLSNARVIWQFTSRTALDSFRASRLLPRDETNIWGKLIVIVTLMLDERARVV
jgi:hypothetical protein